MGDARPILMHKIHGKLRIPLIKYMQHCVMFGMFNNEYGVLRYGKQLHTMVHGFAFECAACVRVCVWLKNVPVSHFEHSKVLVFDA